MLEMVHNNKPIHRIAVIDDKPDARESMFESVEDADFEPIVNIKELLSIDKFIPEVLKSSDAAIFDYHLKVGGFASFNGAEAVARLYSKRFPALLVTTYAKADIDEIRLFRRNIPVLIPGGHANPDGIIKGLEKCIAEFNNTFSEDRKAYRTLVRIEEIDKERGIVFAVIPAWNPDQVVRIPLKLIPESLLSTEPIIRLFADVNIGAQGDEDLYFENFTIAEKPRGTYAKLLRS